MPSTSQIFRDRRHAGRELAAALEEPAGRQDALVLGLARGGMPIAAEVAKALALPLDVFVVRKLGVPGHEELAMGAIASGGTVILNRDVIKQLGMDRDAIDRVTQLERAELARRESAYRGNRDPLEVQGRTLLLIDDGLATGASMRAAVRALRLLHPARIVVAVPVGSAEACADLEEDADAVVCLQTPTPFSGVGRWYEDFSQTTDEEVQDLLRQESRSAPPAGHGPPTLPP